MPSGGISTFKVLDRNRLYLEIDAIGFKTYAEKLLREQYAATPLDELFRLSGLRSMEKELAADPRLRVLHSWNDPLLTPEDARFLDRTFGGRIVWVSGGGHLGDLGVHAVQRRITALAGPPPEAKPEPKPAAPAK